MNPFELEQKLNQLLDYPTMSDYAPNGLQVQGCSEIKTMLAGVTATQYLIDKAIELKVDALLVHHGFFWKNEPNVIVGMKYKRLQALLSNNINLYAYHLPLDCHPIYGNNVQLATQLDIPLKGKLDEQGLVYYSELEEPITLAQCSMLVYRKLKRKPLTLSASIYKEEERLIKQIAWTTGAGQNYIHLAAEKGMDLFISGEVSESTTHIARELGIHYISAGHHATEKGGVQALIPWLKQQGIKADFIDDHNPV